MTNEAIEAMVEEVMRDISFGDYTKYNNEELREKYRKMLREENENAGSEELQ